MQQLICPPVCTAPSCPYLNPLHAKPHYELNPLNVFHNIVLVKISGPAASDKRTNLCLFFSGRAILRRIFANWRVKAT